MRHWVLSLLSFFIRVQKNQQIQKKTQKIFAGKRYRSHYKHKHFPKNNKCLVAHFLNANKTICDHSLMRLGKNERRKRQS